ncbi:MAG: peptide chain release factor N(5)-glutamine methyltransferase [Clostridia bacterium]|nr:peptide chain release factor N(5)-glutamine methyltransferase [Clostridia bacterium]
MTSLFELYRWGVEEIKSTAPDTAEYETAILIEKFFNVSRTKLLSMGKDIFPDEKDISSFRNGVKTRKSGEPLQYILGQWEFYGLAFKVGRGVLVPRADTETLVDEGLEYLNKLHKENPTKKLKVLDLCSGSGCIAISVAKNCPFADVVAVELNDIPLSYTLENIALNDIKNISVIKGDVLEIYADFSQFDLILSNPPYIPTKDIKDLSIEVKNEPLLALDGGDDGLIFYRALGEKWADCLAVGGKMMVEIGIGQESDVEDIFRKKLSNVHSKKDLNGIYRVVVGTK